MQQPYFAGLSVATAATGITPNESMGKFLNPSINAGEPDLTVKSLWGL